MSTTRSVLMFRHNTGGRKRLVSAGRFAIGYARNDQAPDDERHVTVINYEQVGATFIFEVKPHDVGEIIKGIIEVVANHNILPKRELLENIIGSMPYTVIVDMLNLLPENARRYVKQQIQP